jgi:hypothetical protein
LCLGGIMKIRGKIYLDSDYENGIVRHHLGDVENLFLGDVKKIEFVKSECGEFVDFFVTQWPQHDFPPESTDREHLDKPYFFVVYNHVEECYNWFIKDAHHHITNSEPWSSSADAIANMTQFAKRLYNMDTINVNISD